MNDSTLRLIGRIVIHRGCSLCSNLDGRVSVLYFEEKASLLRRMAAQVLASAIPSPGRNTSDLRGCNEAFIEQTAADKLAVDTVRAFHVFAANVGRALGTEDVLSTAFFAPNPAKAS